MNAGHVVLWSETPTVRSVEDIEKLIAVCQADED